MRFFCRWDHYCPPPPDVEEKVKEIIKRAKTWQPKGTYPTLEDKVYLLLNKLYSDGFMRGLHHKGTRDADAMRLIHDAAALIRKKIDAP